MTAFNKNLPKPAWLDSESTNAKTRRYYNKIWRAQPAWADVAKIRAIYREAERLRSAGEDVEVDHIMPLNHPDFCGLHVHWNLQIVPSKSNRAKSNDWYPGHPQADLFERTHCLHFELEMT